MQWYRQGGLRDVMLRLFGTSFGHGSTRDAPELLERFIAERPGTAEDGTGNSR